jgi:AcrR family transcriptional regulator
MAVDRRTTILRSAARVIAHSGVRGLRVEEVARQAGVSTALLYYHFSDRFGLLQHTLEHINQQASSYTEAAIRDSSGARAELEQLLLLEFQDDSMVVENSKAWGELRASAVFDDSLQESLRASTMKWSGDVAAAIRRVVRDEQITFEIDPDAAGERLTALVEGLSGRWLSGTITLARAQSLMREAIARELAPVAPLGLSQKTARTSPVARRPKNGAKAPRSARAPRDLTRR